MMFSTKFFFTMFSISGFWNILISGAYYNSVSLNIILGAYESLEILKSTEIVY